jgi:hypothetical protein
MERKGRAVTVNIIISNRNSKRGDPSICALGVEMKLVVPTEGLLSKFIHSFIHQ